MSKESDQKSSSIEPGDTCPYLGLATDPTLCYSYPHEKNHCHHVTKPEAVDSIYQENTCLTSEYNKCIVYENTDIKKLPKEMKYSRGKSKKKLSNPRRIGAIIAISSAFLILFNSQNIIQDYFSTGPLPENRLIAIETESLLTVQLPSAVNFQDTPVQTTQTALFEANATISPPAETQTSTVTLLAFSTLGPDMMTPFGPGGQYILHTVQPGESLTFLALTYETTTEVLERLNVFQEGSSFWVGRIILVIPNRLDPSGIGPMQVIRVEVITNVDDISEEYGVSPNDLRSLNSLGNGDLVLAGRWLIIPFVPEDE